MPIEEKSSPVSRLLRQRATKEGSLTTTFVPKEASVLSRPQVLEVLDQ